VFRLENGLEVIVVRRAGMPMITAGLSLRGGLALGSSAGAAEVALRVAIPQSRWHGSLSEIGGQIRTSVVRDRLYWLAQAERGAAGKLLGVLADRVSSMDVIAGAMNDFRNRTLPRLRNREQEADFRANRAFWSRLYGDSPYGQIPSADELARIDK